MDFYGNDIKKIYNILPSACCAKCLELSDCVAYTFVNLNPNGRPACYLKNATENARAKQGAVSSVVDRSTPEPTPTPTPTPPTPTPAPTPCDNPPFASCGDATGVTCCQDNYYCQPWSANFYQCMARPVACLKQETDTEIIGDTMETLYGNLPTDCCDKCSKTPGCKGYTFQNDNPGTPACYLMKTITSTHEKKGAVSGYAN